jgi:hypothetical protein
MPMASSAQIARNAASESAIPTILIAGLLMLAAATSTARPTQKQGHGGEILAPPIELAGELHSHHCNQQEQARNAPQGKAKWQGQAGGRELWVHLTKIIANGNFAKRLWSCGMAS